MTPRATRPILIAGGGIGGLAAAIALANAGYRCRVLERRSQFDEAGAGIQIGPNGVKALRALGIDGALATKVGTPEGIAIRDGLSGRLNAMLPLGADIESRLGAPYWTAHRADLHDALAAAAARHRGIALTMGFAADRLEATEGGVRIVAENGAEATGAALIGADGLWSRIRGYVADRAQSRFAGRRAYRAVIAAPKGCPPAVGGNVVGLWLARGSHVVHYPVRAGAEIAAVVILSQQAADQGWSAPVDASALMDRLRHLDANLQEALTHAQNWRSWDLFEAPPLKTWSNGRIALLGDAAHPVLPFLAQGGVLALEDALTLAHAMTACPGDIPAAFAAYSAARLARARRVAKASQANGAIYHWGGGFAMARTALLGTLPANRLIGRYDWLYGWSPPGN